MQSCIFINKKYSQDNYKNTFFCLFVKKKIYFIKIIMLNQVLIKKQRNMASSSGVKLKNNRDKHLIICLLLQILLLPVLFLAFILDFIWYFLKCCCSNQNKFSCFLSKTIINFIEICQYREEDTNQYSPAIPRTNSPSTNSVKRGLTNLGNTCYMNSSLRLLLSARNMIQKLEEKYNLYQKNQVKPKLLKAFLQLDAKMKQSESAGDFSPRSIKKIVQGSNPHFSGTNQHDAGQWLLAFFNLLRTQLNENLKPEKYQIDQNLRRGEFIQKLYQESIKKEQLLQTSILDDIIYGHCKTEYACLVCNQKYTLFQKFLNIQLQIPDNLLKPTLPQCWNQYSKPVELTQQNNIFCHQCNLQQKSKKTMTVYQPKEYLMINLNRGLRGNQKNNKQVNVPFEFTPKLSSDKRYEYQLIAMINHLGSTRGGHYTATSYEQQTNHWYKYSDSQSWKLSQQQALQNTKKASILLYRKK